MKKRAFALLLGVVLCFGLISAAYARTMIIEVNGQKVVVEVPDDAPEATSPSKPTPPVTTPRPSPSYDDTPTPSQAPSSNDVNKPASTPNGTVSVDKSTAELNDTVTITVTPNEGYQVGSVAVKDANGNDVAVKDLGNNKYSFTMPGTAVTIDAEFTAVSPPVPVNPFVDVKDGDYFYDAVLWAVANGVTEGKTTTTFAPNDPCTRAQIVTFLWRAMGSLEVETSTDFTDVAAGSYYEKAVAWAVANGVTTGKTDATFAPNEPCTRAQAVTFLHRAEQTPAASGSSFSDVASGAYYENAVIWAVANGITDGTGNGRFSPNSTCTRGQIVTFLYRDMV